MKSYVCQPILLAALGSWAAYFFLWLNWYELAHPYLEHGDVPTITGPSILFMHVFHTAAILLTIVSVLSSFWLWRRGTFLKARGA